MSLPSSGHRRHNSAGHHASKAFRRTGSSGSVLEIEPLVSSPKRLSSSGIRQRPGSDSDILESKTRGVSLNHHDSLTLAYHQRPSVVAMHSTNSTAIPSSAAVRQTKSVFMWTQNEVCKWLKRHIPSSDSQYADIFAQHDITGKTLLRLNDAKLKRMGVKELSHRNIILNEILKLQMKNFMQCFKGLQSAGMFDVQ